MIASAVLLKLVVVIRERADIVYLSAHIHWLPIHVWLPIFAKCLFRTDVDAYIHRVPRVSILYIGGCYPDSMLCSI